MHVIRPLKTADLEEALALVWSVFLEFEAPGYAPRGVEEFRAYIALPHICDKIQAGAMNMWGCMENGRIIGVIATAPANHISLLFVDKQHHRQGVARALFQTALEYCKEASDQSVMTVNSSPYAHEAYHHLGFADTDGEQVVNGIRFTPMQRVIRE